MSARQDLEKCIQQCQQTASQLRGMAGGEMNPQVKTFLSEAAHHLDLCITECQYSLQQIP